MVEKDLGVTVIDLFCGAGGFSEGFHQAGFDVVIGIDNWEPACRTHTINNLGVTRNLDLLEFDVDRVLSLKKDLEKEYGVIDVIIGSPPCTEFSYAKKGGKGDTEKGMLLVRRHLLFVALFNPKYWLMENVPRLENVLNTECKGSRQKGWTITYEKLGIPTYRFKELGLKGHSLSIPQGDVFIASDYGTYQNRKRFIAGNFPLELMEENKVGPDNDISLGKLLKRLEDSIKNPDKNGLIIDHNYPHHKVKRKDIRDYDYDTSLHPMYWEEMRHMKRRAIQYGRMHLPENLEAPARTIMAYYNSSSRESLIFETGKLINYQGKKRKVFRQPTVREIACIQGFPLDFQLSARRIADRYKLIGNAVPCQLAYAHAKSILQDMTKNNRKQGEKYFLKRLSVTTERQENNNCLPIISSPKEIIDEAVDNKRVHEEFGAQYNKHLRRKLLSSTIPGDSNIIIFENSDMVDSKLMGTHRWKSCLQRGIGKQYHQIYLDEISIDKILNSLTLRHKSWKDKNGIKDAKALNILKSLLRHLFSEVDRGIPILNDTWTEFPGWDNIPQDQSSLFTGKRRRLPDIILFQVAFTNGIKQIDGVIGPIDFFDGLDAIMLRVFNSKKFRPFIKELVVIEELYDQDIYPHRSDSRISTSMKNVKIPLVTIMAGLLSVYVLYKMYKNIKMENNHAYFKSLKKAHDKMKKWCIYPKKNH